MKSISHELVEMVTDIPLDKLHSETNITYWMDRTKKEIWGLTTFLFVAGLIVIGTLFGLGTILYRFPASWPWMAGIFTVLGLYFLTVKMAHRRIRIIAATAMLQKK